MEEFKICSKCKTEYPRTSEYFHVRKKAKDGLTYQCKVCRSKQSKVWRENNREYTREYARMNYEENKEENRMKVKKYREENIEKERDRGRKYYHENKEKMSIQAKKWKEENQQHLKEYNARYYIENKEYKKIQRKQWGEQNRDARNEYMRIINHNRRAKLKGLANKLSPKQWKEIKEAFNDSCAYCGMSEGEHKVQFNESLHQEHFIPLTEGGEYTHNNIIPACRICNSSKNNNDFFEWYPTYEHYDERREKVILEHLNYMEEIQQLALL